MTNEHMRRTMEFIVEQQAQFAVNIQRLEEDIKQLEEERIRDRPRLARLEESFQRLVDLSVIYDSRLDGMESKTSILEESFQRLVRLVEISERRLEILESRG